MSVIPVPRDPHAEQVMTEVLRRMTPGQRLEQVDALWESLQTMIRSQLATAHPDWPEGRLSSETARRMSHDARADYALRDRSA